MPNVVSVPPDPGSPAPRGRVLTTSDPSIDRRLSPEALLRILAQVDPASPFYRHTAALLDRQLVRSQPRTPAPTPRGPRRLLTIGMATYDDYDGVYFTVQAIRLYHPEVTDRTEILVIDNHPDGPCAGPLKELDAHVPGYRYLPYGRSGGTAVREVVFREANSDYVLCVDSHVLFRPGALARLLEHVAADPDCRDLWQGPLLGDDLGTHGTHFDPVWRAGMYGVWAADPRGLDPDAPAFEIPMQGLGVFGCRRAAWPGFNPRLRGFGGEEGYLHEKIRRAGGRTLCLPFLGWLHRFNRPFGPRYEVSLEDRVRNYLLVHDELGLDASSAIEHFEQVFGAARVRPLVDRTRQELHGPFHFFDAIYGIDLDGDSDRGESLARQCGALGVEHRLRRFSGIDTPTCPEIGRVLSHRAVVAEARWLGLHNVLVLDGDVLFSRDAIDVLTRVVSELATRPWRALYLDVRSPESTGAPSPPVAPVRPGQDDPPLHAVAYHHTAFDRILADLPDTPTAMARWLRAHPAVGRYFAERFGGDALLTRPAVAVEAGRVGDHPLFEALPVEP